MDGLMGGSCDAGGRSGGVGFISVVVVGARTL